MWCADFYANLRDLFKYPRKKNNLSFPSSFTIFTPKNILFSLLKNANFPQTFMSSHDAVLQILHLAARKLNKKKSSQTLCVITQHDSIHAFYDYFFHYYKFIY